MLAEIEATTSGGAQRYLLPLGYIREEDIVTALPQQLALARVRRGRQVGLLTDAFVQDSFAYVIVELMRQGAAAVVIACNTATAAAATHLRARFELPIVAMEPAVKPAVSATRTGVVGVLATVGTLESARFAALLEQYAGEVKIVSLSRPSL